MDGVIDRVRPKIAIIGVKKADDDSFLQRSVPIGNLT